MIGKFDGSALSLNNRAFTEIIKKFKHYENKPLEKLEFGEKCLLIRLVNARMTEAL